MKNIHINKVSAGMISFLAFTGTGFSSAPGPFSISSLLNRQKAGFNPHSAFLLDLPMPASLGANSQFEERFRGVEEEFALNWPHELKAVSVLSSDSKSNSDHSLNSQSVLSDSEKGLDVEEEAAAEPAVAQVTRGRRLWTLEEIEILVRIMLANPNKSPEDVARDAHSELPGRPLSTIINKVWAVKRILANDLELKKRLEDPSGPNYANDLESLFETIKEQRAEYRKEHKDKINEQQREYYDVNKDEINKRRREGRAKKKQEREEAAAAAQQAADNMN
ncbi:MAG: hypothetical protein LBG09_01390 [Puniceicoccales bacterium]|jgi:hypothetical protein|nr:hypothetical protein [Puniceicoccales bacterium]